jgi:hypothetical protein
MITIKIGKWGISIEKRRGAKSIELSIGWNTPMFSCLYLFSVNEIWYGSDNVGAIGFGRVDYARMVWHSRF